jgi:hypothetical protein
MRIKTGWAAHTDGTRKHGKLQNIVAVWITWKEVRG